MDAKQTSEIPEQMNSAKYVDRIQNLQANFVRMNSHLRRNIRLFSDVFDYVIIKDDWYYVNFCHWQDTKLRAVRLNSMPIR